MKKANPSDISRFLKPRTFIIVVLAILVVILLGTSVFMIDQTEEAVITRFGRFVEVNGPGLHFKLPFGIDRHYVVNTKNVQTAQFGFRTVQSGVISTYSAQSGESTMLTGDLNIAEVEWIIQYRIVDPRAWVFNVQERTKTITDVSRSAINMLVGDRAIMDIMGPERSTIEMEGILFMNETFNRFGLGISVIAVKLQNIDPPGGVRESFDDVNKAIQDMNRLINEGQQVYNEEIPKARGQSDRVIQVAQGYAAERVNKAQGDVARFVSVLAEYRRSPEVTRTRLYYEMIEEVFGGEGDTVFIDRNLENIIPIPSMSGSAGGR